MYVFQRYYILINNYIIIKCLMINKLFSWYYFLQLFNEVRINELNPRSLSIWIYYTLSHHKLRRSEGILEKMGKCKV